MQHPDEGTIHAWLDGALPPEEGEAINTHAAACAQCSAAIAEARGLIAASSRIVSALDIVPGGVIPVRAAARRPWYGSTQLRAAAAVLFIAGASMLLLRDPSDGSLEDLSQRVMSETSAVREAATAAPETTAPETTAVQDVSPRSTPQGAGTRQIAEIRESDQRRAEEENRASGKAGSQEAAKLSVGSAVADAATAAPSAPAMSAPTAPPPVPMPPAAAAGNIAGTRTAPATLQRDSAERRVMGESVELSNVVVTGVASGSLAKQDSLIVISADSAMGYKSVRYRTAAGIEVLLTEERTDVERQRARAQLRTAAPVAASRPPQAAQSGSDALPITTIEWLDATRQRKYVLSGRVTKAALERIKAQIESSRR